jgi:hypothetical protein
VRHTGTFSPETFEAEWLAGGGTEVTESFRMTEGLMTTLFGLFGGQLRKRRNVRDMRTTLERIKAVVEA